jgi:RNA polymerase sigma factor (sigma-70 family)
VVIDDRKRETRGVTDADVIQLSLIDGASFALLFDRHFRAIYRFLAGRAGAEVAEDLASETFTVAFRRRDSFDTSRDDARPWLYGIAVNLLHEHHRAEVRRLRAYARAPIDAVSNESKARGTLGADVSSALRALSPEDRTLILLFAWAELTYEQLGEALRLPVGTVRSRLNGIRAKLRKQLVPEDFVEVIRGGGGLL